MRQAIDTLVKGYMSKIHFPAWWLVVALTISGCSVEINQPSVAVSPIPGTQNPNESPAPAKIPITWANLNLTGKLVYVAANSTTARVSVQSLNLETGDLVTIFQVPQRGWVDAVAVSPDHQTLILSFSPPMESAYGGQTSLYHIPLDGSEPPQLLITPQTNQDLYFQPTWSPDGKYIYLAHINYESLPSYEIMRMVYPDGKPETLIDMPIGLGFRTIILCSSMLPSNQKVGQITSPSPIWMEGIHTRSL